MLTTLINACNETLLMLVAIIFFSCLIGIPLGFFLFFTCKNKNNKSKYLFICSNTVTRVWSNLPHLLFFLLILSIFKKFNLNNISYMMAIVPCSIILIPKIAILSYDLLSKLPHHLFETSKAIGATKYQSLTKIYIPEILSSLIKSITSTSCEAIQLITIAGVFGAGGLGTVIIQNCSNDINFAYILAAISFLLIINYIVKTLGFQLSKII